MLAKHLCLKADHTGPPMWPFVLYLCTNLCKCYYNLISDISVIQRMLKAGYKLERFLLQILVHGRRLGNRYGRDGRPIQAVDVRPVEPNNKTLNRKNSHLGTCG